MKQFNKRKVARSLGTLNKTELQRFEKWLKSPWRQNKEHHKLWHLYSLIAPYHKKNFDHHSLQDSILQEKLFPRGTGQSKSLNTLCSNLQKEVNRFLIHERIEEKKALQMSLLLQDSNERHREDTFQQQAKNLKQRFENLSAKKEEDYLLTAQGYDLSHFQSNNQDRYNPENDNLTNASNLLDQFYILRKYRYQLEALHRNKILSQFAARVNSVNNGTSHKEIPALPTLPIIDDQVYQFLKKMAQNFTNPLLRLYEFCIDHPEVNSRSELFDFKQRYLNEFTGLDQQDQKIFFNQCCNYLVKLSTKGDLDSYRDLFTLYQLGLEKGILIYRGQLSDITYNNIVLSGTLLGEISFVQQFVQEYTSLLPEAKKTDAEDWATGQLFYSIGQYLDCVHTLRQKKPATKVYQIQQRVTLTKAYYELESSKKISHNSFITYCAAFEKFVQRDKNFSAERSDPCINWIRYTRRLAKLRGTADHQQKLQKLKTALEAETNVYGRLWLHQKIKEEDDRHPR